MRLIILTAFVFCISFAATAANPTEKVLDAFRKTFPLAKDVVWSQTTTSFQASFNEKQITLRVNFDKKGNIINTLRYYHGENLPIMILARIHKKFADKNIFGVVEESTDDGVLYHITLEGTSDWIMLVGNSSRNLTVEEIFKKA
jgi:hypothetical protein